MPAALLGGPLLVNTPYDEKDNLLQTLVEPCTFENFDRKLS